MFANLKKSAGTGLLKRWLPDEGFAGPPPTLSLTQDAHRRLHSIAANETKNIARFP
jgi:hypothetical protein